MTTVDLDAIRARLGAAVAAWSEATGDPNDALPQQASAADVPVLLDLVEGLRQELDEARAERDRLLDVYRKAEAMADDWRNSSPHGHVATIIRAVDAYRSAIPDAEPAPRVWHLPPEPGLEVTRVVDTYGQHFERQHDEHPGDDVWIGTTFGDWADVDDLVLEWNTLMAYQAPLTDATPEPAPGVPVDTEDAPSGTVDLMAALRASLERAKAARALITQPSTEETR